MRDFGGSNGQLLRYDPFKALLSLPELTETPSYFRREVRQSYQMTWSQLGDYISSLRQAGFDTARLSVQWQKKFAFPLIGALIVFLGAPFAFLVGTRGAVGGLALAVGIGIVYWSTAALFEAMGSVRPRLRHCYPHGRRMPFSDFSALTSFSGCPLDLGLGPRGLVLQ